MSEEGQQTYIYEIPDASGGMEHYVSVLPHEVVLESGLPAEAVLGKLVDGPDSFDPEHFAPNARFVEFLHEVIAKHAGDCPGLKAEAERQQDGHVYIVDFRTSDPQGGVPPEDIVGAVQVQGGSVTGYQGNPNYRVFTASGLMQLDPWFREKLLEELQQIVDGSP